MVESKGINMDEEIKIAAYQTVNKIYRKIKKIQLSEYHKLSMNIGIGADGTPTKYIDKVAEDIAINFIKKSELKINILSEESGYLDFNGDYTFIIDPIDGTRNAIRGIPLYSISIGVGKNSLDDIGFGIVKNIPTGDIYTAEKDKGAFFNKKRINTPEIPGKEMIFSFNNWNIFQNHNFKLKKNDKLRSLGCASIEMCMVAIGALDFYVVYDEYLRVTDIAASSLIVKEAGGFITNIQGNKLDLNLNLDERTSIITACNKELINRISTVCKDLK
jgi:fructose-1,6-bisphosphatase/inositol monophosphatase family enzyme